MSIRSSSVAPKVLNLKQASAYSGLPLRTLRNLVWGKQLRVIQLIPNGKIYIPIDELDKFLEREVGFISFMGCWNW